MSDSTRPVYMPITGVVTQVNPTSPPPAAVHCHNFRVMPSTDGMLWLRLFGGRLTRAIYATGLWKQFHEFRDPFFAGFLNQLGQNVDGATVSWWWISLTNWLTLGALDIDQNYGGSFTRTTLAPVCNADDGIILYNGLGVRDTFAGSKPAFSVYFADNQQLIYLGLDCFIPVGFVPPTASSAGGGSIEILNEIQIYVGLFNTRTYHFSNVVPAGRIAAGVNRTIHVASLTNIRMHNHGAYEEGLQKFVFFATADLENAEVGYLMMDPSDPTLPIMNDITDSTIDITDYLLDTSKEAPTENFPPRPMRWVAAVNGRIYGALLPEGGASPPLPDFSYIPPTHYLAGIVWSAAASDVSEVFFLGAPEHAYPLDNFRATPNTEQPLWGAKSPEGKSLHVVTPTANFLVFEDIDERHDFVKIPGGHGINNVSTYCPDTEHGTIWEDQCGQIVTLDSDGSLNVLSRGYQDKLRGKVSRCATYTRDPDNMIDRYELFFTDGTEWIHDFVTGQGYSADADFTAAKTLHNQSNRQYHICANKDIFTGAGQPEDTRERVKDDIVVGVSAAPQRRVGEYETHWLDFGDPAGEGNIAETHIHGDVRSGNLVVHAWRDHQEPLDGSVVVNVMTTALFTVANYMCAMGKALLGSLYTLKLRIRLTASNTETTYPTMYEYGRSAVARTMLGAVGKIGFVLTKGKIRLH